MNITAAAHAAGVKVSTLRFYEREGLLLAGSRSLAGYRQYSPAQVRQLRFIRRAQDLGFTLQEIRQFLDLSGQGRVESEAVQHYGTAKLADLTQRITDLQRMHRALTSLLDGSHASGSECPVIAALADSPMDEVGQVPATR